MTASTTFTPGGTAPRFYDDGNHHPQQGTLLGFWIYLMSDCLLFAVLFATYAVLGRSYAAGPSGADLFDLPVVATNTALLLFSSITYGMAMIAMQAGKKTHVLVWLAITGLFGLGFLSLELTEFAHLIHEGSGPQR
ncbi:MAG TPA: cytochrome o ubiquinol oxidase subunit III, partial [Rhodoferax sp.]